MTAEPELDTLRDAIQAYVNDDEDAPLVVTDFVISYAAIDMHTADTETTNGYATGGSVHASLGLAHILVKAITDSLEGDDE